jgi:hypothetical protein
MVCRAAPEMKSSECPGMTVGNRFKSQLLLFRSVFFVLPSPMGTQSSVSKKKPDSHRQRMIPKGWNGLLVRDAQAACGFNCLVSKCAPFFHRTRVIAAIFRAKVRRAIAGFMPLVSKPW